MTNPDSISVMTLNAMIQCDNLTQTECPAVRSGTSEVEVVMTDTSYIRRTASENSENQRANISSHAHFCESFGYK
jgi:hypothetical protein